MLTPAQRRWRANKLGELANYAATAFLLGQSLTSDFRLDGKEVGALNRSQIVTGSQRHRDPRYPHYAFTQEGVAMLSSVLPEQASGPGQHPDHARLCRTGVKGRKSQVAGRRSQVAGPSLGSLGGWAGCFRHWG